MLCVQSLSSSVVLEHHGTPQGLEVAYQAYCTSPGPGPPGLRPWSQRAECKDIKINQQVGHTLRALPLLTGVC